MLNGIPARLSDALEQTDRYCRNRGLTPQHEGWNKAFESIFTLYMRQSQPVREKMMTDTESAANTARELRARAETYPGVSLADDGRCFQRVEFDDEGDTIITTWALDGPDTWTVENTILSRESAIRLARMIDAQYGIAESRDEAERSG